ncbi:MAG: asparagine synthase (glutamine-hydrolyzing) [Bacteroidetes bacterium]|nr:asparagine synthase (glutamine-hydrolyzing) [Bacteroidota bacterium]
MCGIAGFIDPKISNENANVVLEKMLQAISHRGPDARGIYNNNSVWLGHNRLSIIDLSEEANQPFHYEKYIIIFNGEIYNYLEIKSDLIKQGHSFRTNSDTEVICAAYKKWGADCVKQFVGMWAFVIYDTENGDIFCSRDRFGIKPFYYMISDGRFYFASEIKALKQSPIFRNDINLKQVARGLQLGWLSYDDETYFEKIKQLPAAHSLICTKDKGELNINRYWNVTTGNYSSLNFKEKKNTFRKLFEDSIKLHLRSDVPVASCLSGGLDSSAIVSMVQELNPGHPYKSFSIYYDESGDVDERPFIQEVIKNFLL